MPLPNIGGYYNRFDPSKHYDKHLFRSGKVLQSPELNEVQENVFHRLRGISDVIFKDGDVIRDAQIIVNAETGETLAQSGAVYLSGAVRGVEEASFAIATEGVVTVGIYLSEHVITEIEDEQLRDPAQGTRGFQEPGAARLQVTTAWGFDGDGQSGEFYPVYTVEDGVLRSKEPPPNLDAVTQALARYDRDSAGGTYVVEGLIVGQGEDTEDGKQVYTISEGRARVNGYGVELYTSRRILFDAAPDPVFIDAEPHMSEGTDAQRVDCDHHPVGEITQVRITTEKTVSVVHAGFTGASDPLPDNSVLSIVSVTQDSVTYAQNTDYRLTSGQVDWSPAGAEPAPGSTYSVTYRYIATVAPMNADDRGFTVTGAVLGTLILVSYNHLLPRIDRIVLTPDGAFQFVKGVAAQYNPIPPYVAPGLLPLATILQTWDADHRLINDSVRTVKMDQLYDVSARLDHILALIAQQRLEASANMIEAGMKKSLLVDPFLDDSIRDAGIEQTGLILGEELQLDIPVNVLQLVGDIAAPQTLAHDDAMILAQTLRTGDMRINPYDAFDAIPNQVTLTPAFDNWTTTRKIGSTTNTINSGSGNTLSGSSSSSSMSLTGTKTVLDTMRSINVAFSIKGWEANEAVATVKFDGIELAPTSSAGSASGVTTGSFLIPPGVAAGRKKVEFIGAASSYATTTYEGSQTILDAWETVTIRNTWRNVVVNTDPLAQTFTLPETCQIAAVDLWFTAKGTGQVVIQIRGVANGVPNQDVLAQAYVDPADILTNGNPTRIRFDAPAYLTAETEYAIVALCDDAIAKLALAELGKYDSYVNVFVTSQPYQIGVLLSSSNASTWTAHQDRDLTFRLLRANYTQLSREIPLGAAHVEDATDLILLAPASRPETPARVSYRLTLPGEGGTLIVDSGQRVQLSEAITGEIGIAALIEGTARVAPIVWPGSQLVFGTLAAGGDYVSRAVLAGQDSTVKVIFDAVIPAGASVTPTVSGIDEGDDWQTMTLEKTQNMDDGFIELTFTLSDVDEQMIRLRLALAGAPNARPRVRNLRMIVT
jgi:hypothetical protein